MKIAGIFIYHTCILSRQLFSEYITVLGYSIIWQIGLTIQFSEYEVILETFIT